MQALRRVACFLAIVASPLVAQRVPERPRLSARADTNSWEAYYDFGVSLLRRQPSLADAAFYWASRIDPTRAEPLFGRWVAFWMADARRWEDYVRDAAPAADSSAIQAADSLRYQALLRSPFVNQALVLWLYDRLPGRWRSDAVTQAWLAYGAAKFDVAAEHFGRAIRSAPRQRAWLRYDRAAVFVAMTQYDSALAELTVLADELRRRARDELQRGLETTELVEYGIAILYMVRGDYRGARAALDRALVDNLGFYPALALRGRLALATGDAQGAARELRQTVELKGDEGRLRHLYGTALLAARRAPEAVQELRQAVALEPYYAAGYLTLGAALEEAGEPAEAAAAYRAYLTRAPRTAANDIARAQERLRVLAGS